MWDTRYRPLVFSDVLGQEGSVRVLRARLLKGLAFDTSYIFAGGFGSGKTTLARILARAMLCQNLRPEGDPCNVCDHCQACLTETMVAFTEFDAASQGTVADMRRIVEHLAYDVPGVPKRIYLLDEAHRMSRDAQDVLLKPIEDKRVVLLFCTTEYAKIRDTIRSRAETYEIRKIKKEEILLRAKVILESEGVSFEDEAILTVIDFARGHVRDVINQLETIAQLGPVTIDAVRERLDLSVVSLYYDILLALGTPSEAISRIEEACDRVGAPLVVTGLAEAAMNAFRHANNIYTDYSELDQERAAQVYARFGSTVTDIARYFLSLGAHVSRLDLVCAAVALEGGKVPPAVATVGYSAPPVVFVNASAAVPSSQSPSQAVTSGSLPVVRAQPAVPSTPQVPVAVVPKAKPPTVEKKPPTVEGTPFVDNSEPTCAEDAAQMASRRPKGHGHSNPGYTAVKPETHTAAGLQPLGYGLAEFTANFNEIVGILSNGK